MFKRSLLTLLLAASTGLAFAEPPKPMLWKVSDADNSIYLLGSFHLLLPGDYPLADSTYAALDDAEQVVMELTPQEMNDPTLGQRMMQAALRSDGKTLQQTLPAETWAQLEAYAAKRSLPIANFQNFEPWFVGLMVSVTEMQALGLDPGLGLDKHFAERALAAGKPVQGLETGDQQIALFDSLGDVEQLQSLQDGLAEVDQMETEIRRMHALWRQGDDAGLFAETAMEMKREMPELYQRLNVDRNKAWMPRLQAMLDKSSDEDTLVVVGAMHLLGEDGVVKMLRDKGYTVERL